MSFTTNLNLKLWGTNDPFSVTDLSNNFNLIDNQFTTGGVLTTPVRFIEKLATIPVTSLSEGRLIYLTADNGGFKARSILRYNNSSGAWETIASPEMVSVVPTTGNYIGRTVLLSAANGGFNAFDIIVNTDGANAWSKVGTPVSSATIAGFTQNYAGKIGFLSAKDIPYEQYGVVMYTGSSWKVLSDPPTFGTSDFGSLTPFDALRVVLAVDTTNGINWEFKYRSGSASSYKWEYVGGAPMFAEVTTSETTSSLTYAALATAGPAITLPRAGDYLVEIGARVVAPASTTAYMSYDIGGTGAVDADAVIITNADATITRVRVKTGLTAVTLTAKYKLSAANATSFANRWMKVTPIRVS